MLLCLYSYYIGKNNEENFTSVVTIFERFKLLPRGLWILLTDNIGVPLLLFSSLINVVLVSLTPKSNKKRQFEILKYIGLFSVLYLILLPFGGYRFYRPYIIRYDTFSPIVVCLIFTYGITAIFLLEYYHGLKKRIYAFCVIVIMFQFTRADGIHWGMNKCNKESITYLSKSPDKIVFLDCWSDIMSWGKSSDYNQSELNCRLLKYWGVLKEDKLYYQLKN
jgi:hypothetical protein